MSAFGGAVRLEIPPNALSAPLGLTLRRATAVPLDPHAVPGAAYAIEPVGTVFAAPATLTIRYDPGLAPSGVAEGELQIHALAAGSVWQPLAHATAAAGGESAGEVTGGGTYGVSWNLPSRSCSTREDRQFDFWIGAWNFSAPNAFPGTDDVTLEGNGCLIEEHFRDTNGAVGRSVSLLSRVDGRWHQTYIDSLGGRLVFVGAFDGRRMVLGQTATSRSVWEATDANTVRFYEERTTDGGQTWQGGFFDSRYVRR